jgi:cyanate permease
MPFNNISSAILREEYGGSKAGINVGVVQGVPYAIAALTTPFIGILVDV